MDNSVIILGLGQAGGKGAGGKAEGLSRLIGLGLNVPPGFVIIGARHGELPQAAVDAYRALGGKVAVRSSALGEDGAEASFAGQYESVLNVDGEQQLREAVDRCLRSLDSPRAQSYRAGSTSPMAARSMAVVVQRMVEASAAGVLFTLDPITGRKDRMAIDAVSGLGERLVSGHAAPDHFAVSREGKVARRELAGQESVLSDEQLALLVSQASQAEEKLGQPLDMEWAFDAQGRLFWLQARPITVTAGDLHEFDWCPGAEHVYTTANIGEMISGAVCPLTISTTAWGIDHGCQRMWHAAGTHPQVKKELQTIGVFNGHLFLDMTAYMPFNCGVAGASPEVACTTIVGQLVPELLAQSRHAPWWKKAVNGARFMRYILGAGKQMRWLDREVARFAILDGSTASASWEQIDQALGFLCETYKIHLQVSGAAAVMAGVLEGMIAKRQGTAPEKEALTAGLLANAGEVVSAQLIHELEAVLGVIERMPQAQQRLIDASVAEGLAWLTGPESGEAGGAFRNYLGRWGHRAYRELDLREKGWADDPSPLVVSLRASLIGRKRRQKKPDTEPARADLPVPEGGGVRWALEKAKKGVVQREFTKNLLVHVTDRFKRAYRRVAAQMVVEGMLEQEDDIFFFTHDELGRIVRGDDRSLAIRAELRRDALERQQAFTYPVISVGVPEPEPDEIPAASLAGELRGKPVSPGVATGRARVAVSLKESEALLPGEILIAPCADVGWTPYFNLIAGLATEVGSAFCHGAVVAREYGLPTVVNVRNATKIIQTGDLVLLDADHGVLRKLTADEAAAHKDSRMQPSTHAEAAPAA